MICVIALPDQQAIPHGFNAFSNNGSMVDAKLENRIRTLGESFIQFTNKMLDLSNPYEGPAVLKYGLYCLSKSSFVKH
jgi:hypothetical protein